MEAQPGVGLTSQESWEGGLDISPISRLRSVLGSMLHPNASLSQIWFRAKTLLRYRGTSLIRTFPLLGPYNRNMPMALWQSSAGGRYIMIEVPL